MTTSLERTDELIKLPVPDALAALRQQGLLPASTTERVYQRDPVDVQPSFAALAQISPRNAYIAGRASMSVSGPQWFIAGDNAEIGFRWVPGTFGSIVWLEFRNLGANRNLLIYIELRVNPPGAVTFILGGTGNPTSTLVSNQSTGDVRTFIPLSLKSTADGRAIAYVTPQQPDYGGAWYSATLYGF